MLQYACSIFWLVSMGLQARRTLQPCSSGGFACCTAPCRRSAHPASKRSVDPMSKMAGNHDELHLFDLCRVSLLQMPRDGAHLDGSGKSQVCVCVLGLEHVDSLDWGQ